MSSRLPPTVESLPTRLLPVGGAEGGARREALRPAATMVVLFPRDETVALLLTRRPESMTSHPGQISLPGGRAEAADRSLWDTAARETREELGMPTDRLVPLGRLEPVLMRFTGHHITPFVGWYPSPPALSPDPAEVDEVIEVTLDQLLDPVSLRGERWRLRDRDWNVTFYQFGPHQVWGATARMLGDLAVSLDPERTPVLQPGSILPIS